ncbi:MAG: class I SAM-dependent methyltransferase [Pseudomonadota bacterium]
MTAADTIIELYERRAHDWDRDRGRALPGRPPFEAPWLDRFLALQDRPDVLDVGCGSGDPIARYVLEKGAALVGIDASPSLIAICRGKFPAQDWIVADMRALDLGRAFTGILAWHSMIHLTPKDQAGMFPILRGHARPGTILMFTSGHSHGEVMGQWHGEPLYHGSLDVAEYETLLANNGFDLIRMWLNDPGCGHATVWVAQAR